MREGPPSAIHAVAHRHSHVESAHDDDRQMILGLVCYDGCLCRDRGDDACAGVVKAVRFSQEVGVAMTDSRCDILLAIGLVVLQVEAC
jgi:hypothetical protein